MQQDDGGLSGDKQEITDENEVVDAPSRKCKNNQDERRWLQCGRVSRNKCRVRHSVGNKYVFRKMHK